MGYYNEGQKKSGDPKIRSGFRWFWPGLLGGIIGVLLAALILPEVGLLTNRTVDAKANQQQGTPTVQSSGNGQAKNVVLHVNGAYTSAVNKVSGAIVEVINYQKPNPMAQKARPYELGSGIVYKKKNGKAYIVTNNHVVEGASRLEVKLEQHTKVPAMLVGRDPLMDLAVIKVNADKVKEVAQFGNSSQLKRGEPVIAIGDPLGLSGSVTEGVVSATHRTVPRDVNGDGNPDWRATVIQTDAAINPGNSGGALINLQGKVVGINSMKIAMNNVSGIGFSIPINVAKPIIHQIEKYGKVIRPHLGIYYRPISDFPSRYRKKLFNLPESVKTGLYVARLQQGGPAAQAGIRKGDVITAINGHTIKNAVKFKKYLYKNLKPGQNVQVTIYRNGKKLTLSIQLGKSSSTS
ncbi:MAG TPA: S1C family serine protease [Bacillales bacterium]|nr:S1C family serine protease [Bacillales bacterium]